MRFFLKVLKWLGLAAAAYLFWLFSWPWVAVMQDDLTAEEYTAYLEEHKSVVDAMTGAGLAFDEAFYDNRLFLFGEIHGYGAPQDVDFALLQHLNEKAGVRYYLAEMDPVQAMAVNYFLLTGEDEALRRVFDGFYEDTAQWGNREFFAKIGRIRSHNEKLNDQYKIYFLGVDKFSDKSRSEALTATLPRPVEGLPPSYQTARALNEALWEKMRDKEKIGSRYANILSNIAYLEASLPTEKFYGLWGIFHAMQVPVSGSEPLAMRLEAEGPFAGAVATITSLYASGSMSMMPTQFLPEPLTGGTDAPYTLVPANNDDVYLYYVRGINDLKKAAGTAPVTLFNLRGEGSPYLQGRRLVQARGFLTGLQPFIVEGSAGQAADYLILFQGSPALTPWKGEAYDVTNPPKE